MKTKYALVAALFPLLILAGCDDSNKAKLKKQEDALNIYQKSVKENQTEEQRQARDFLSGKTPTKSTEFSVPAVPQKP